MELLAIWLHRSDKLFRERAAVTDSCPCSGGSFSIMVFQAKKVGQVQ